VKHPDTVDTKPPVPEGLSHLPRITTWRYCLPALPGGGDSWSIIFLDSTGCVAVCSDYGDWCYRWQTRYCGHDDFRQFLAHADSGYVAHKLGCGRREELQVYDGEATRKHIQRYICERRREGGLSKEEARHEWALAGSDLEDNGQVGFHEWYLQTEIGDAYEFAVYRMSHGLHHWMTVSFRRLQGILRAQLAAERGLGSTQPEGSERAP
jgi:hypothetical protein